MPNEGWTFVWGAVGSVAIEVATLYGVLQAEPFRVPVRYRKRSFWCVRVCLALIAGALALAHRIVDKPLLAFHVGVATPLILQGMRRGLRGEEADPPDSTTDGATS